MSVEMPVAVQQRGAGWLRATSSATVLARAFGEGYGRLSTAEDQLTSTTQRTDPQDGCPRCGSPLGQASGRSSIDGPLQPCPSCGGIVLRDGSNEWDLLGSGKKTAIVARRAFVALTIGLVGPLVYLGAAISSGRAWQLRYVLLSLAIGWVLAGSWQVSSLLARIRRSRRRMGDPMYLAKLVESEMAAISRR